MYQKDGWWPRSGSGTMGSALAGQTSNRGAPAHGGRTSQERRGNADKARTTNGAYGGPPAPSSESSHREYYVVQSSYGKSRSPNGSAYARGGSSGHPQTGQTPQAGGVAYEGAVVPYGGGPTQASLPPPGRAIQDDGASDPAISEAWQKLEDDLAAANRRAVAAATQFARTQVAAAEAEATKQLEVCTAKWAEDERKLKGVMSDLTAQLKESRQHARGLEDELTDLTKARSERGSTAFSLQGFAPDELTVAAGRAHQAIAHFAAELARALTGKNEGIPLLPRYSVPAEDNQHVLTGLATATLFRDFEAEGFDREGASCLPETAETEASEAREKEKLRWDASEAYLENLRGTPFGEFCRTRRETMLETVVHTLQLSAAEAETAFADPRVRLGWELAAAETWRLQRMAHFCSPPPRIVRRVKGMPVDEFCQPGPGLHSGPVLFMLMPGFKAGGVLVSKCQVYPVPPGPSSEAVGTPQSVLQLPKHVEERISELEQALGDPSTWSATVPELSAQVPRPSRLPPYEAP